MVAKDLETPFLVKSCAAKAQFHVDFAPHSSDPILSTTVRLLPEESLPGDTGHNVPPGFRNDAVKDGLIQGSEKVPLCFAAAERAGETKRAIFDAGERRK